MPFCQQCGANVESGVKFCTECGAVMQAEAPKPPVQQAPPVYQPVQQPIYNAPPVQSATSSVMSVGAYIGAMLLFAVPIIGFIFCIVWACGGAKNKNRQNFARATIVMFIIGLIVCIVVYFAGVAVLTEFVNALSEATVTTVGGIAMTL